MSIGFPQLTYFLATSACLKAKGPDSDFKTLKHITWSNEKMMRNSLGF